MRTQARVKSHVTQTKQCRPGLLNEWSGLACHGGLHETRRRKCRLFLQLSPDVRNIITHHSVLVTGCYNYANPVYGVATICHQVRCLRWGHPSLFHTATSLLIWYKIFCMRDISYRITWMKFIYMLSVYAQSGTHRCVNWWIIAVLT